MLHVQLYKCITFAKELFKTAHLHVLISTCCSDGGWTHPGLTFMRLKLECLGDSCVLMYCSISSGIHDKPSVSPLAFPGWYLIENLKSANSAIHHCVLAFNIAVVNTYVKGLLLV